MTGRGQSDTSEIPPPLYSVRTVLYSTFLAVSTIQPFHKFPFSSFLPPSLPPSIPLLSLSAFQYYLCCITISLKHNTLVSCRSVLSSLKLDLSSLTDSTNSSLLLFHSNDLLSISSTRLCSTFAIKAAYSRRTWYHCGVPRMERSVTRVMRLNTMAMIATSKLVAPEDVSQTRGHVYCPLETMVS